MMPNKGLQNQGSLAEGPLIAVVDDDASFLRSVGRLLRSVGYVAETFSTGREFLSSLSDRRPQCLVADLHMLEMSDPDLQERLAAQGCSVPVIYVAAYDTPQMQERARKLGSCGLLLKPFDNKALLQAIREAIELGAKVAGNGEREAR